MNMQTKIAYKILTNGILNHLYIIMERAPVILQAPPPGWIITLPSVYYQVFPEHYSHIYGINPVDHNGYDSAWDGSA